MNKLSKIFLVIIIILTIALTGMTYAFFYMMNVAKHNLELAIDCQRRLSEAYEKLDHQVTE
ncbi:MAG: hypothetical protein HFJ48_03475 [Clostridia bacterium]|nr:hypothetical protein [Clostridia bacterium]